MCHLIQEVTYGDDAKRLQDAWREVHPDKRVFPNRAQGTLSIDWIGIVRIDVPSRDEVSALLWNNQHAALHQVDRAAVAAAFRKRDSRSVEVSWERI